MHKSRYILGTAGHVDHGKTELVRALTGVDTDRLKEEKARGISIELGFAPLPLGDDIMIGIVDVPGHEKFVKQMVAGAGGIDLAILVVAADEGVMPQTQEHMEVLRSLSVEHGAVVLTKSDLSSDDMTLLLEDEVQQLVAGSFLEGAPIVKTSAKTGEGIDELKALLRELASKVAPRDVAGPFRLAIDRVFGKQGIGSVVTGSCYSGTVSVGDKLMLLPSEKEVRVRELQSFGEKREQGFAGERLAIALTGRKLTDIERGEMLVTPDNFEVSYMVDARVRVAAYAAFELKQRERVRVHHGAREVLGRVVILDADKLESGEEGLVQLRLETPIVAGENDYFVIRKYSPSRVLGGGRVIVPRAAKHKRNDEKVIANLQMLEKGDPTERLHSTIRAAGLAGAARKGHDPETVATLIDRGEVIDIDKQLFDRTAIEQLIADVRTFANEYVKQFPLRAGIDKEELRQRLSFPHAPPMFNRVLEHIAQDSDIFVRDYHVRVGDSEVSLSAEAKRDIEQLVGVVRAAGVQFPKREDVQAQWRGTIDFDEAVQYARDRGWLHRIGDGLIDKHSLENCVDELRKWFDAHAELSVAEFKDLLGMTRKHAIPLLEYFDEHRMTARRENTRVRGPRLDQSVK